MLTCWSRTDFMSRSASLGTVTLAGGGVAAAAAGSAAGGRGDRRRRGDGRMGDRPGGAAAARGTATPGRAGACERACTGHPADARAAGARACIVCGTCRERGRGSKRENETSSTPRRHPLSSSFSFHHAQTLSHATHSAGEQRRPRPLCPRHTPETWIPTLFFAIAREVRVGTARCLARGTSAPSQRGGGLRGGEKGGAARAL